MPFQKITSFDAMKQGILRACVVAFMMLLMCCSLMAQTAAYTVHTIASGETLSALAKNYHTTVGDIMRLNGMHTDSKLVIGEKIKIPASSAPVTPAKTVAAKAQPAATAKSKQALTHKVQSGESLYHISKMYSVPVEKLVALNHISNTGEIKVGQVLLISDGMPPLATTKAKTEPVTTPLVTTKTKTGTVSKPPVTQPAPAAQQPANELLQQSTIQPKQAPAIIQDSNTFSLPASAPAQQNNTPAATTGNTIKPQVNQPVFTSSAATIKEGFFTTQFRQNVEGRSEQTKTGASMTFKSASGWADKKFYILMNDAPPGSIVKVMAGNNAVYAKVLWSLGAQKENDGLDFRISTATAAALNITDEKFDVTVTYFQ